ncbi:AzlC family ABC transporter permease [Cypionkella sp.]|uniref:AzlC family ABC transporter permease n=1 Tax=Cypionkella sp. TaxID=2811411 RepID=UPI002626D72F|nr:AzlC family ABC transporter permease [Cypionkella sp.]MDB5665341.1 Branched-chain amino acid transporter AzlC [Cypionkella sp.]
MSASRESYLRGVRAAVPFAVVIVPFGMLFGLLASEAGLQLFEIMAFSFSVFAGASQFAALHLLQDHAPLLVIITTALAVNLRMLMYSVTLAPHVGASPLGIRAVMAYFLVDQSFALSVAEFEERPELTLPEKIAYFFGAVTPVAPLWFGSTVAGAVAGSAIPPEYALDFAVPITFLAMTAPMIRSWPHAVAAGLSVALTLALAFLPYGTGLLVGSAIGMAAGAGFEYWREKAAL